MKNLLLLTSFFVLFLTGCATQSANFQLPKYDKEAKTLNIDGFVVKNVVFDNVKETKMKDNLKFAPYIHYYDYIYKFNTPLCKKIRVMYNEATGDKYFRYSRLEDIREDYNNKCEEEKLYSTDITFVKCPDSYIQKEGEKEKTIIKYIYGVFQSTTKKQGYGQKLSIGFNSENKKCFDEYKKYLFEKYKPKK